jgi:hypothetical protein
MARYNEELKKVCPCISIWSQPLIASQALELPLPEEDSDDNL